MTTTELTAPKKELVTRIKTLIEQGVAAWQQAGQLIAQELDEAEDFEAAKDELCLSLNVGEDIVMRFYAIGKKLTFAPLLIADGPGVVALLKCPYDVQERYATQPLDVLVRQGNDWATLKITARNLTGDQAKQVFKNGEIRSIAAQRAFIESRNTARYNPNVTQETPYVIRNHKLVIRNGPTFTATELLRILAAMER